jgi:hypothetical protein
MMDQATEVTSPPAGNSQIRHGQMLVVSHRIYMKEYAFKEDLTCRTENIESWSGLHLDIDEMLPYAQKDPSG